jgi:hypothetical protein
VSESHLEEFLTLVTRDLGAQSALVLDAGSEIHDDETTLVCDVPGGRTLVVRFSAPPADVDALRRRLAMLASAFGDVLPHESRARASRPPPARSLHEELAALVSRVGAVEAVIIDAHSPVLWGAAGDAAEPAAPDSFGELRSVPAPRPSGPQDISGIDLHQPAEPPPPPEDEDASHDEVASGAEPEAPVAPTVAAEHAAALTERAIVEVRGLPDLAGLRKGGHLRHSVSEPDFGCVARSFAAIYVLVVVFDGPFEELLIRRAIAQALPTIERLVAALPPLDPRPTAGVVALRSRRRR